MVVDALHGDSAAAAMDEIFGGGIGYADLQAFVDHTAPAVKASGCGSDGEEELEWLSNKDAFPTVETMGSPGVRPRTNDVRQSRAAAAAAWSAAERRRCRHCGTESTPQWREGPTGRRTLCNACGLMYKAGRLLPEYRPAKSPTFASELHSNRHHGIVKLRRRRAEAVQTSLAAAAGYGRDGGQGLEPLANKSVFLAVNTMAALAGQRPRTKGLQRPRRVVAWSPPPPSPPRTPAQGRVPGGGAGADGGRRAAAPAGGGVEAAAPRALAVTGPRQCQGGRDGMAVEQPRVPGGGDDGVGGVAAADAGRALGQLLNQPGPGGGEMALGQGLRVPSCTAGGGAADKGRAAAALQTPACAVALQAPASAAAQQRWCQHCGTGTTPQWREGPDGKRTLCNACGLWYKKSGVLVPEYRPASSPTFSPTLHSSRRSVVQRLRASPVVTAAIAATPTFSPMLHSSHRTIVQRLRASLLVTTGIAAAAAAGDAGDK